MGRFRKLYDSIISESSMEGNLEQAAHRLVFDPFVSGNGVQLIPGKRYTVGYHDKPTVGEYFRITPGGEPYYFDYQVMLNAYSIDAYARDTISRHGVRDFGSKNVRLNRHAFRFQNAIAPAIRRRSMLDDIPVFTKRTYDISGGKVTNVDDYAFGSEMLLMSSLAPDRVIAGYADGEPVFISVHIHNTFGMDIRGKGRKQFFIGYLQDVGLHQLAQEVRNGNPKCLRQDFLNDILFIF